MARLVTIGSMRLIHIENRTQPIFEQKVDPRRNFAQRFRFRLFFVSEGAFDGRLEWLKGLAARAKLATEFANGFFPIR
jgi:hypothetical protein